LQAPVLVDGMRIESPEVKVALSIRQVPNPPALLSNHGTELRPLRVHISQILDDSPDPFEISSFRLRDTRFCSHNRSRFVEVSMSPAGFEVARRTQPSPDLIGSVDGCRHPLLKGRGMFRPDRNEP
jgi:hypothetical protein